MKYYLLDTSINKDGTNAQGVFIHDDLKSALIAFHDTISYKMKTDTVASALVMVVNEMGGIEKSEKYIAAEETE